MQTAIASGNKVEIRKRRQNDNEEGDLKKIRRRWQRKQAHKMLNRNWVRRNWGNENDKEVNSRKKRLFNTCCYSKLSSLQIFSAVISFLKGELGLRIDGSAPSTTILCEGNSSLYHRNFSTAPLETRSDVDIRAQLKTGEACNRCTISIPSSQLSQY